MYTVRILKNLSSDRVNIHLSASENRWESEVLRKLADLMERYEILRLHLPSGKNYVEIKHFPMGDLKEILVDLEEIGFIIKCPFIINS